LHFADMLQAGNAHPPLTLRVNARRTTREAYLERLAGEGIEATALETHAILLEKPMPVDKLPGFAQGLASVQDASAQRAAPLLDVRDGMRVLDACAAPGGKTAHLLELADIHLIALDEDAERLRRVGANLERLGLGATLLCGDARNPNAWWDGKPFDRILADVPCSASGVTRRHPDIKWLRRPSDIAKFVQTQEVVMDALWRLLAAGGKLLYVTCSLFREENHLQVARFLERHADAQRLSLPQAEFAPEHEGQILPDARHDGFYYALLRKT
jgi:16S rRNA (cytosine967-C5)-methyltransferase